MRMLISCTVIAVSAFAQADEVRDSCVACHKAALSLADWDAAALAARLKEIRDGRAPHPVPIPALDDAKLEALARALTTR